MTFNKAMLDLLTKASEQKLGNDAPIVAHVIREKRNENSKNTRGRRNRNLRSKAVEIV